MSDPNVFDTLDECFYLYNIINNMKPDSTENIFSDETK